MKIVITVVGSFNMDLFIETDRFPGPGETLFGKNFRRAPGGKGSNQALTFARMGQETAMIGAVGRDSFGDEMVGNLSAAGVDVSGVVRRDNVASGTAVITLDASGENTIIVANGANDTLSATDIEANAALIAKSKALVIQLETSRGSVLAALGIARKNGVMTFLNPAPYSPVDDSLLKLCDWLIPNEIEASKLTGVLVSGPAEAAKAAEVLRAKSNCQNIVITLGPAGVWLDTADCKAHVPGFEVQAVDTVGAGDTFIGAFVSRLMEGAKVLEAAKFGCAAAAIAVTRRGAQSSIPARDEVGKFLYERGNRKSTPAPPGQ
jgi:ribokinase